MDVMDLIVVFCRPIVSCLYLSLRCCVSVSLPNLIVFVYQAYIMYYNLMQREMIQEVNSACSPDQSVASKVLLNCYTVAAPPT